MSGGTCLKNCNKIRSEIRDFKNYFKTKIGIQSHDARYNKLTHDQLPLVV